MSDLFSRPDTLALVMIFGIPMVAIVASCWSDVAKNRDNNTLKQSMIDQGMSAEEIERVIHAGTKKAKKC